jgi:hypothetical protein
MALSNDVSLVLICHHLFSASSLAAQLFGRVPPLPPPPVEASVDTSIHH